MSLFKREKKNKKSKYTWLRTGVVVSFIAAVLMSSLYGMLRQKAESFDTAGDSAENMAQVSWLYQCSYLLYRDLYNIEQGTQKTYSEIYLQPREGLEWLLDRDFCERLENNEIPDNSSISDYIGNWGEDEGKPTWEEFAPIRETINNLDGYFANLDSGYTNLNTGYDYLIRDNNTGETVTNMSELDIENIENAPYMLLQFTFDSRGHATVENAVCEGDSRQFRKTANEVLRSSALQSMFTQAKEALGSFIDITSPTDCTVTFAISKENKMNIHATNFDSINAYGNDYSVSYYGVAYPDSEYNLRRSYIAAGSGSVLLLFMFCVALLGCFLPIGEEKPWVTFKPCAFSLEILFVIGCCYIPLAGSAISYLLPWVASGQAAEDFAESIHIGVSDASYVAWLINLISLCVLFLGSWYFGICARAIREKGMREYLRERSLIYRFFPFMRKTATSAYQAVASMDLTKDARKMIGKVVLINALILFVISSLWFGGLAITVIYSVFLYLALRKYISDLQKKYSILLQATNEIAEGNLNVSITADLGVFEPFKPQIIRIQNGFRKAVNEEVKSQKMKAELITNVSHDLKTPLTAIITYVNLLKEANITEEQRKEYLDILERKSLRLKSLIEDLFEVSKANSQTITLNRTNVDIMSLVKQVSFEMSDKLEASGLDVRMNLTEEKLILNLDSQKTYRIYENLFGNIAKYAMPGTRVYVNGFREGDAVVITLKNISAQELTVNSEDLTERFVRGDASRNTEGSGLGLAIAKSFTVLQGGELLLEVDGDLFKVTTKWKLNEENH